MNCCQRPISDDFINALPEEWVNDSDHWVLRERKIWEAQKKPVEEGGTDDQDHPK